MRKEDYRDLDKVLTGIPYADELEQQLEGRVHPAVIQVLIQTVKAGFINLASNDLNNHWRRQLSITYAYYLYSDNALSFLQTIAPYLSEVPSLTNLLKGIRKTVSTLNYMLGNEIQLPGKIELTFIRNADAIISSEVTRLSENSFAPVVEPEQLTKMILLANLDSDSVKPEVYIDAKVVKVLVDAVISGALDKYAEMKNPRYVEMLYKHYLGKISRNDLAHTYSKNPNKPLTRQRINQIFTKALSQLSIIMYGEDITQGSDLAIRKTTNSLETLVAKVNKLLEVGEQSWDAIAVKLGLESGDYLKYLLNKAKNAGIENVPQPTASSLRKINLRSLLEIDPAEKEAHQSLMEYTKAVTLADLVQMRELVSREGMPLVESFTTFLNEWGYHWANRTVKMDLIVEEMRLRQIPVFTVDSGQTEKQLVRYHIMPTAYADQAEETMAEIFEAMSEEINISRKVWQELQVPKENLLNMALLFTSPLTKEIRQQLMDLSRENIGPNLIQKLTNKLSSHTGEQDEQLALSLKQLFTVARAKWSVRSIDFGMVLDWLLAEGVPVLLIRKSDTTTGYLIPKNCRGIAVVALQKLMRERDIYNKGNTES